MAAQDLAHFKAWGDVTVDLLKRLDIKVDFAAVDWGTVVARTPQKSPPHQGGWHMFITYFGIDSADPTNIFLRANGNQPWNGWANSPPIEAEIAAWYDAASLDEESTPAQPAGCRLCPLRTARSANAALCLA